MVLLAMLVALFGIMLVDVWWIKIIKQDIVITSCCNITLFCRVNAQHQFLSIRAIKQDVVITSCCNIVLFYHVNAQHQFLSIKLSDAVLSCCFVVLFCRTI